MMGIGGRDGESPCQVSILGNGHVTNGNLSLVSLRYKAACNVMKGESGGVVL